MFTPRAVEALGPLNILDSLKDVIAYGEIPLKENKREMGYYLLPFSRDNNWREKLPEYFDDRDGKLANSDRVFCSPL